MVLHSQITRRARVAAAHPINKHLTRLRRYQPSSAGTNTVHTEQVESSTERTHHTHPNAHHIARSLRGAKFAHMPSVTPPDLAWRGEPGGAARGRMRNGDAFAVTFAANEAIRLIGDALREDEPRAGRAPPGELGRSARHGDADRFASGRVARASSRALRAAANATLIGSSLDD